MEVAARTGAPAPRGVLQASLGRGTRIWAHNLVRLASIAAAVWVPAYVLQLVLALGLDVPGRTRAITAAARGSGSADAGSALALGGYAVATIVILMVALPLSHGALIAAAGCFERGAPCHVRDCYRLALQRFWSFLGALLLVSLLILLAEAGLLALAVILTAVAGGNAAVILLLVLAGVALPLLLAVPFTLAPQVVVLEHASVLHALRRSRQLLGGRYFETLALLIALGVVGWLAGFVTGLPVRLISAA